MSETTPLFTNDLGEPLTFVTSGCKFYLRVTRLVMRYGGDVVVVAGPHTVVLAPESSATQRKPSTARTLNTFSHLYVQACVKHKTLLPLKDFWVHRDPKHDNSIDLNDIMLGYFTWDGQLVRQPPKQQPSSITARRDGAGKPQRPPVKKCSVVLENLMLQDAANGTCTSSSSQTKRPRRGDSRDAASRDAEEEKLSNYSNLHRDKEWKERGPASSMSTSYHPSYRVKSESIEEPLNLTSDEEHGMMEEEEEEEILLTDDDSKETDGELSNLSAGGASDSRATRQHPQQNNEVRAATACHQRRGNISSKASTIIFNMGNLNGLDRTSAHSDRKLRNVHPRRRNGRQTDHQTGSAASDSDSSSSESQHGSEEELRIRTQKRRKRRRYHPAIEEDEEEEEDEEPVLRNVQARVWLPIDNTKLSKEAENKQTRRQCRVDAGSSSETRWKEITPKRLRVYGGKRLTVGDPAKDQAQTRAASSRPGPSGNTASSTSRGTWISRRTASTSSETSSRNNCPLFKSPSGPVAERKGSYRADEDVDILKYILSKGGQDRVGGRAFWQEMEEDLGHRRTWQSLKERYRKRILPNLMSYESHGLDPTALRQLGGMKEPKKELRRRAFRAEFTLDEDLHILKFISQHHRYGDVGGLLLWQEMEDQCPMLVNHPFSSLKTRFMKKILPNIGAYNLTDDEVHQFKNRCRLREHQKKGVRRKQHVPRYTRRRLLPSEMKSEATTSTGLSKKPRHQDIMTTDSDEEESQSEDTADSNNLAKRLRKRAQSLNETRELLRDRPAQRPDMETHPADTPQQSSQGPAKPQRKRLLVVDKVMDLSPKTPFRVDSDPNAINRRKKELSEAHKNTPTHAATQRMKNQQSEAHENTAMHATPHRTEEESEAHRKQGPGGVVEESSQDEPMGRIVLKAEVHREMTDEDPPQRVNSRGKSPLSTPRLQKDIEEVTEDSQLPKEIIKETQSGSVFRAMTYKDSPHGVNTGKKSPLTIPTPQEQKEQQRENLLSPEVTSQKIGTREQRPIAVPTPQEQKEQETENLQPPEVTPQKTTLTIPAQQNIEEETGNLQLPEEIIEETEEEREVMALENEATVLEKLLHEKELEEQDEMSPGEEELEVQILNPTDEMHIAGLEEKLETQEGRVTHATHTPQGSHFSPVIPCLLLTNPHPKAPPQHTSAGESAPTSLPHQCSPSTLPPHLSPVPPPLPLHLRPPTPLLSPHHSPAEVPPLSPSTPHLPHPATTPPPHLSPSTPTLHLSPSPPPPPQRHIPSPPPHQCHTPTTPLPQHSKTSPMPPACHSPVSPPPHHSPTIPSSQQQSSQMFTPLASSPHHHTPSTPPPHHSPTTPSSQQSSSQMFTPLASSPHHHSSSTPTSHLSQAHSPPQHHSHTTQQPDPPRRIRPVAEVIGVSSDSEVEVEGVSSPPDRQLTPDQKRGFRRPPSSANTLSNKLTRLIIRK